jgi:antitoxin VapB
VTAQGEHPGVTSNQLAPIFEREISLYASFLRIAPMSAFSYRVLRSTTKTAYPLTHIRIFVEEYPMSLYIRDPDVAALAAKLQDLTGSRTKTEAVRLALQQAIERANAKRSFAQRNAHVLEMADALGSTNSEFDSKAFFDQMWGDV